MRLKAHQLTTIFCEVDDFCKELEKFQSTHSLHPPTKQHRGPTCKLCVSEIMTLLITFQQSGFRDFKTFYTGLVCEYFRPYFPYLVSYNRFVELIQTVMLPLCLFNLFHSGKKTGIYYIDSSCLPVCLLKRSRRHHVFKGIAEYGRTSVGWFFGLKLHLVINEEGELIAFKLTRGSAADSTHAKSLLESLEGLAFGDKGYISNTLFEQLNNLGLKLITRKRKNMKKPVLSSFEQQLLNQRNLVETVIGHLKEHFQIWHTRHRSLINALTHLLAGLAAYTLQPLKFLPIKPIEKLNEQIAR